MPHLTKTAPSGRDISARPALTYLHLYIFYAPGFYLYVKDSCDFFTDVLFILLMLLVYMSMIPVIYTAVARG